jgi:hypothetical protein
VNFEYQQRGRPVPVRAHAGAGGTGQPRGSESSEVPPSSARPGERQPRAVTGTTAYVIVVGLALLLRVIVGFVVFSVQGGNELARPRPVHRAEYRAVLNFKEKGDRSGQEWFILSPHEAEKLVSPTVGASTGPRQP